MRDARHQAVLHRLQRPFGHRHAAQGAVRRGRRRDASRIHGAHRSAARRCGAIWAWRTRAEARRILRCHARRGDPLQRGGALGRFLQQAVLADPGTGRAVAARRSSSIWCATGARSRAPISTSSAASATTTVRLRCCRPISTIRRAPAPPPEKKYWWPVPRRDDPLHEAFRSFDQFERIAWHWAEINRVILDALAKLAGGAHMFVRLEDLLASPALTRALFDFLNLPYRDEHFRDLRAAAQRQPAGRPPARRRAARHLRAHRAADDGPCSAMPNVTST